MTRSSTSPLIAKKARLDRLRPLSPKTLEAVAAWAAYIDALQLGDDPRPYQRFMAERLEASLDHHLDMLERATGSSA